MTTKNNGTDPIKDDGTDEKIMATDRTCSMNVVNNSGNTITNVVLTHSSGDTNDKLSVPTLINGASSYSQQVNYETGWGADFDYWNISLTMNGSTYNTPYNDRCNIGYEDAGKLVQCEVQKDGSGYRLYVNTPKTSGCHFVIEKN